MGELREESVLFSLRALQELEAERVQAEREREEQARERREAEHRERLRREHEEQDRRVRAAEAARLMEARREADERARLEAIQRAIVEQARIEAEAQARRALEMEHEAHELRLAEITESRRVTRLRRIAFAAVVCVPVVATLAGFSYVRLRYEAARAHAVGAARIAQTREEQEAALRLLTAAERRQRTLDEEVRRLRERNALPPPSAEPPKAIPRTPARTAPVTPAKRRCDPNSFDPLDDCVP